MTQQYINSYSPYPTAVTRQLAVALPRAAYTVLLSALLGMGSLSGCSYFKKSEPINPPAALVQINNPQPMLAPAFYHAAPTGKRRFGWGNGKTSAVKPSKKHGATQTGAGLQVASDTSGFVSAASHGIVTAINPQGQTQWQISLPNAITGGVSLDNTNGSVLVSDHAGKVIALERTTGKTRWQTQLASPVMSPVLVSGARIVALSNSGVVTALDRQTGQVVWQFATQNPNLSLRGAASPIALDATTALVSTADGRVHGITLANGTPLWSRRISQVRGASDIDRLADIDATPVFEGTTLYTISYSGQLVAVDLATGQLLFTQDVASLKSVALDGDSLYATTLDGKLLCLDKITGTLRWQSDTLAYRGLSNAVATPRAVLVGDVYGYIHAFDKTTGKPIDRQQARHAVTHLQLEGNRLLATDNDGSFSVWQVRL
ncbi:PQQ-binding-like beta-propeller repeat protein [Moraxella atlantae]|uniref:PQQ-binding-like beta-propeller repeat protein n=1 Tax=Faucicola atlantae TaxID=34059 RepID=UPI003752DD55